MKKSRNNPRLSLCLTFVLAAFAATSLLECLPLSSASASPPKRKGFFWRSSLGNENSGKDANDDDSNSEMAEGTVGEEQKSSRQGFETADSAPENEDDEKHDQSPSSSQKDSKPSRGRFPFLFRRHEEQNEKSETKSNNRSEDVDEIKDKKREQEGGNVEDVENDDSSVDSPVNKDESSSSSDGENPSDDENDTQKSKEVENGGGEGEEQEQDPEQSKKSGGNDESSKQQSPDSVQQYRDQLMQQQQRFVAPGTIIYRSPPSMYGNALQQQQNPGIPPSNGLSSNQAMAAAAMVNFVSLASRLFFLKWIINKLAFESESKRPVQHFMWECLNDKFIKDDEIWSRVLSRVPHSMGVSQRKWGKTIKAMGPIPPKQEANGRPFRVKGNSKNKKRSSKNEQLSVPTKDGNATETKSMASPETSKTVVVVDFSTVNVPNPDFLRFADVVTFLVGSNKPQKQMFGPKPEIILMLQSPGGEVTSFAFAAAQVMRLRDAGWNVTVCVDRIAASGGYMIASQATQILASPFAMIGSVGVISESLNFYEILKKHGIQSLVLKAGDSKNPITQFGKVTDDDIKTTQEDLEETHRSFIDLCRSRRPALDPAVCNGRILSGDTALERGMIDRILTSDEYILEKISEGDLVMKLHLVSGNSERHMIANALQILPHLSARFKKFISAGGENSLVGKLNAVADRDFAAKLVQIVGLTSMIRRAVMRSGFFENLFKNSQDP